MIAWVDTFQNLPAAEEYHFVSQTKNNFPKSQLNQFSLIFYVNFLVSAVGSKLYFSERTPRILSETAIRTRGYLEKREIFCCQSLKKMLN